MLCVIGAATAFAAEPIVYPAQGQDQAQQSEDEGACFVWARDRSGFNPLASQDGQAAVAKEKRGGAVPKIMEPNTLKSSTFQQCREAPVTQIIRVTVVAYSISEHQI